MRSSVLLDTGPIIAILDRDEKWHHACLAIAKSLPAPLLTSEAVLTEVFHFVGDRADQIDTAWQFLRSGVIAVAPIGEEAWPELHALMLKYADRPMDYADATLVYLAEKESINTVFTIDFSDFQTYRIGGNRKFRIVPGTDAPK